MMHIAMADAVVAIEGRYDPFHARVWASRGASAEAAAAQAGHDVFFVLITTQVGRDAAAALLQSRSVDDSARPARARRERGQEGRGVDPGVASE